MAASPPPVAVIKSPAEKALASSWHAVEQFLERNGLSVALLEQTEDNLRQWFASRILHSLVEAMGSAHKRVEHAAYAATGRQLQVEPLLLSPSVSGTTYSQAAGQLLDRYQLEKWLEVLSTPTTPQPTYDPAARQQLVQAIQDWLGILLVLEGKCPGAKELLLPFPPKPSYLTSRIQELAGGSCVDEFRWNAGKTPLDAMAMAKKWNGNDFPTDSSVLCYLFCVYLLHPNWRFQGDFKLSTPRTSFFIGTLPHKPGEHFRAILPQMPAPTKSTGYVILFQSRFGDPLYTLSTGQDEEIRVKGHSGLFRGLALFLMILRLRDHDWIGQNRLHNLGLSKVVCTENF